MIEPDRIENKYNSEWCRKNCKPHSSFYNFLEDRELGIRKRGTHLTQGGRDFFKFVRFRQYRLTHSTLASETPIRFTPDGRQLISYNHARHEIRVYWYNGSESIQNEDDPTLNNLFSLHFEISCRTYEISPLLVRDICVVTNDSKHLVFSYMMPHVHESANFENYHRNNESGLSQQGYEDVTFMVVDLETGLTGNPLKYPYEHRIWHNVYGHDRLFGIMSVLHQTIYIYRISENGNFTPVVEVGRSLYDDDKIVLDQFHRVPANEIVYMGFKQLVLSFLYKAHKREGTLCNFLRYFHFYTKLRMQKFQFLDADHLLIKVDLKVTGAIGKDRELFNRKNLRPEVLNIQYMFVIYDWRRAEVLQVSNRNSEPLYNTLLDSFHSFKHGNITDTPFPTTLEHCKHVKDKWDQTEESLKAAYSTKWDILKRHLSVLPFSHKLIYNRSPFLDPFDFSYDERLLLWLERSRTPYELPLRIFHRHRGHKVLDIDFSSFLIVNSKPYFKAVLHPLEPFFLITDRNCSDFSPFHIYTMFSHLSTPRVL